MTWNDSYAYAYAGLGLAMCGHADSAVDSAVSQLWKMRVVFKCVGVHDMFESATLAYVIATTVAICYLVDSPVPVVLNDDVCF